MTGAPVTVLDEAIARRAERRGLTADLQAMRYANGYGVGRSDTPPRRALYVGVGHGLDALLALADGVAEKVTGVDPFIATHGNDDDDYETLVELIADLGLASRFDLHRSTIEDYRPARGKQADLVIINDVLHHIFETKEVLSRSSMFKDAVALLERLKEISAPNARLVIGDVSRHGIRPLLGRWGLLHHWIDYRTKQNWREWDAAAQTAGWKNGSIRNYTPYGQRHVSAFFAGPLARYTVCNKYYIAYEK